MIAIDPGFNGIGVAVFDEDTAELTTATVIYPPGPHKPFDLRIHEACQEFSAFVGKNLHQVGKGFVLEFPDRDDRKGTIVDIFKVATLAGALIREITANNGQVTCVFPFEWKGTVPKGIHNVRTLQALTKKELAAIGASCYRGGAVPPTIDHNMIDAIGLGKWRLSAPSFRSRFANLSAQDPRQRIKRVARLKRSEARLSPAPK